LKGWAIFIHRVHLFAVELLCDILVFYHAFSHFILNVSFFDVVSTSLHRVKCLCDRTFACAICLSADVSSDDTGEWIRMPFGVVSGVWLRRGVIDFGGDRRREGAVWG